MQGPESETSGTVILPAVLDLVTVPRLVEELRLRLAAGLPVVGEAGAVQRLQTPGVQMLVAAARSCAAGGLSFRVIGASDAFVAAMADFGLTATLTQWSEG